MWNVHDVRHRLVRGAAGSRPVVRVGIDPDRAKTSSMRAGHVELRGVTDEHHFIMSRSQSSDRGMVDARIGLGSAELLGDQHEINEVLQAKKRDLGTLHLGGTISDDAHLSRQSRQ